MTHLTDTGNRPTLGFDTAALDRTDRLLLGGCVAIWLAALGAGVAATVALVDLANAHTERSSDSGTPWILYTIIGVSAAVIVAAVPLLLRARRAPEEQELTPVEKRLAQQAAERSQTPLPTREAQTEKLRIPPPIPDTNSGRLPRMLQSPTAVAAAGSPAIDRIWLRTASSVLGAMGVATLLVSVATYLMAADTDTVAWVLYGAAGVVTVGMAAIPWYFLRALGSELSR